MILLVCLSRSVSGLHVLIAKPMQTSQYAKMNPASEAAPVPADDDDSAVSPVAIKAEAAADPAALPVSCDNAKAEADPDPASAAVAPSASCDSAAAAPEASIAAADAPREARPATKKQGIVLLLAQLVIYLALAFWCSSYPIVTAIMCAFTVCAVCAAIFYGRRQLGGMNGDIAGYGILWGELFGMLALALF